MRSLTRRLAVLAAAAALTVTAAACSGTTQASNSGATSGASPAASAGQAFPVSIAAANGTVKVASRPTAIVSLSPTATEMLYAIGAGSQVKAVDSLSDYPPQAPRTKLSAYQPNVEAIVAEKPDLVVESGDTGQLTKRLAAFSIPVLELPAPSNFAGEYLRVRRARPGHRACQSGPAGGGPGGHQLHRIAAAAPHHAKPLTYYYELDQTYYSVTSSTFVGQLLAPARHEEHRGPGVRRGQVGWLPAAVRGVHPQGQPGLHHPGRHRLLPSGRRHGGQAARLVRAWPRSRTATSSG